MKDCEKCEFFCGYDQGDGMLICDIDGGFECCPFNDMEPQRKEEVKGKTQICVDLECVTEYVKNTIANTFEKSAIEIATAEIKKIAREKYDAIARKITEETVQKCVENEVSSFMKAEIQVGGGWREPVRMITREQYLSETVENLVSKMSAPEKLTEYAKKAAKEQIDKFAKTVKDGINIGIKENFDETMRRTLTDNVVNMLMSSETYQGLANATQKLLG